MPDTNSIHETPFIYPGKTPAVHTPYSSNTIKVNPSFYSDKSTSPTFVKNPDTHASQKYTKITLALRMLFACLLLFFMILILLFSNVFGKIYNSTQLLDYNKFLCPVVMQNPEPFSENSPPPNYLILNASIWKAASEKDINNYNYDENGKILVTVNEAAQACSNLFGDKIKFDLNDISLDKTFYEYNKEKEVFYVECISYDQCYIPSISEIVELENMLVLKVNYIKIEPGNNSLSNAAAQKQMEYHLKKNISNNNFYIFEIINSNKK